MDINLRRYSPVLAIIIYALFATWLTWPALANLGSAIPGNEGDAFVHLWTYDWVKDALNSGQNIYFTQRLFYPHGVSLFTHNIAWLNIALWIPLQTLVSGSAAYTLVYLIILIFNGLAVYWFIRYLTGNDASAFLAGFIVTGWPSIIASYSHPNIILIAFVPLALMAMHRLILKQHWLDVFWLGLLIAAIGYGRYQMLILSAPMLLLAALYWLWEGIPRKLGRSMLQLVSAGGLALLFLVPVAGPVIHYQLTNSSKEEIIILRNEWEEDETDLLGYLLPSPEIPLIGPLVTEEFPDLLTHTPIGVITLALAILGLFAERRDKWLWLGMALVLLVLALGRNLIINGQQFFILPYSWLEDNLFAVQLIRYPNRFAVLLSIPIAALAGYSVLLISSRFSQLATLITTIFLALIIGLEYRVPDYPLMDLNTPDWYQTLAEEEGSFGLVSIPLTRIFDEQAMYYQLTHNKALVSGHVSRPPREAGIFIENTPFLAGLRERTLEPPSSDDISGQLRPLAENNLPYLIIHKSFLSLDQINQWRHWIGIAPLHEDNDLLVYPTGLVPGEDYKIQSTSIPGLAFVEGQLEPTMINTGDPITGITHWSLESQSLRDWLACYEIINNEEILVKEICQTLSFPESSGEGQLLRNSFKLVLDEALDVGTYGVYLSLSDEKEVESDPILLGSIYVTNEEHQFNAPVPENPLFFDVGQSLSFLGYDGPNVGNQNLDVTLFWHARKQIGAYYKFYVHVIDIESGDLVAQLDTVPWDWTYPTNEWQAGEYVSDQLSLPLSGITPGTYKVEIGVYDPDTGQRLPVMNKTGKSPENNSISLGEIQISD